MTSKMIVRQPQPALESTASDEWTHGICDCFEDMNTCCFGCWCYPCLACITTKKYGECLCLPLVDLLFVLAVSPVTMSLRSSMRQRYGIRDTMCRDCAISTFCTLCAWCQMAREMEARKIPVVLVSAAPVGTSSKKY